MFPWDYSNFKNHSTLGYAWLGVEDTFMFPESGLHLSCSSIFLLVLQHPPGPEESCLTGASVNKDKDQELKALDLQTLGKRKPSIVVAIFWGRHRKTHQFRGQHVKQSSIHAQATTSVARSDIFYLWRKLFKLFFRPAIRQSEQCNSDDTSNNVCFREVQPARQGPNASCWLPWHLSPPQISFPYQLMPLWASTQGLPTKVDMEESWRHRRVLWTKMCLPL